MRRTSQQALSEVRSKDVASRSVVRAAEFAWLAA